MTKQRANLIKTAIAGSIIVGAGTLIYKAVTTNNNTIPDYNPPAIGGLLPSQWSIDNTHFEHLLDNYNFENIAESDQYIIDSINKIMNIYPNACIYIGATGNKLGRLDGHEETYDKLFHLARTKKKAQMSKIETKFIQMFWNKTENILDYSTGLRNPDADGWYYLYIAVRMDGICENTENKQMELLSNFN